MNNEACTENALECEQVELSQLDRVTGGADGVLPSLSGAFRASIGLTRNIDTKDDNNMSQWNAMNEHARVAGAVEGFADSPPGSGFWKSVAAGARGYKDVSRDQSQQAIEAMRARNGR